MRHSALSGEKIDELVKQKYSSSFMSNTKWVKLIQLLVDNYSLIKLCQVKLIYDNEPLQLIVTGDEQFDLDFYSESMEGMVANPLTPGFTLYKEIEWICFPGAIEDNGNEIKQDFAAIKERVDTLGQFRDELTGDYYRVYAYR